jgi:hypothetical protein
MTVVRDTKEVEDFLARFSDAVVTANTRTLSELWAVPAFVLGEEMVRPIAAMKEIEEFFGGAKEQYNARGIKGTHADILRLEWVSDNLVIVDVRWPYIDEKGSELGEESSTYTLLRDKDGRLKLRIAVMRGASQPH